MEKMGNMATDGLIRRPFQPHRPSPPRQKVRPEGLGQPCHTRISNRKSGIRIPRKPGGIRAVRISNRKYFAIFHLAPQSGLWIYLATRHPSLVTALLIYGCAIRNPRKALKT
jgi:hypothetical protein